MPQAREQAAETKERPEETRPRREKGTGTLWKKENGTWMGRIDIGRNAEGKRKYKNFSGKTEAEVKRKIREYNKSAKHIDDNKITVGAYIQNWLSTIFTEIQGTTALTISEIHNKINKIALANM